MIGKNDLHRKGLTLIVLLCLINLSKAFVEVYAPPYVLAPESSDVNLSCFIKDNQGAGPDKVKVAWQMGEKEVTQGIKTIWNKSKQVGQTTLYIPTVSTETKGSYICIVWIDGSADYKRINLETFNIAERTKIHNEVNIIPHSSKVNMWNGRPLKINCTFSTQKIYGRQVTVKWWKINTVTQKWEQQTGVGLQLDTSGGIGSLNISNPITGKSTGKYVCVVTCGDVGNFGLRVVKAAPRHETDIESGYSYSAEEGSDFMERCMVRKNLYNGWIVE
ncbi:V-type Ig domain protein [Pigeonpox virus]|nr:V-type Ig domain protein [Pigeonpox virus]